MKITPFSSLCTAGFFAIFSSTISKSPVLPLFASHLGGNPSQVGMVAAVSAFAGVVFSTPAGLLADRLGRRKMLVFSAVIFATAPILYLFVSTIWQLALVRFYHGFATAIFIPVAMALVSELYDKKRGEKMGLFSTATLLGRFMAPIVGGGIISLLVMTPGLGYRAVYGVCGLAGAIALFLALKLPEHGAGGNPQTPSWNETFSAFKSVIAHGGVILTSIVEAAILFAYGTFETFLPLYAVRSGINAYEVGALLSAQVITLALSKPYMGRVSDRYGRRPQIVAGAVLGAFCMAAFPLVKAFAALLALSVAFGMSLSVVTSATSAYIADLSSGETRGSAMGLLGSIMDIGHTTGPLVSGIAISYLGYAAAFAGTSAVLLLAALFFFSRLGLAR